MSADESIPSPVIFVENTPKQATNYTIMYHYHAGISGALYMLREGANLSSTVILG